MKDVTPWSKHASGVIVALVNGLNAMASTIEAAMTTLLRLMWTAQRAEVDSSRHSRGTAMCDDGGGCVVITAGVVNRSERRYIAWLNGAQSRAFRMRSATRVRCVGRSRPTVRELGA